MMKLNDLTVVRKMMTVVFSVSRVLAAGNEPRLPREQRGCSRRCRAATAPPSFARLAAAHRLSPARPDAPGFGGGLRKHHWEKSQFGVFSAERLARVIRNS